MEQFESPLVKVSDASRLILLTSPAATYDKIKRKVFPEGVVVHLGNRSIRFHKQKLLRWLESGGGLTPDTNGNGSALKAGEPQADELQVS